MYLFLQKHREFYVPIKQTIDEFLARRTAWRHKLSLWGLRALVINKQEDITSFS